jgi:hypothetical protein
MYFQPSLKEFSKKILNFLNLMKNQLHQILKMGYFPIDSMPTPNKDQK